VRYTVKDREFFSQPAEILAPQLLGKTLCHKTDCGEVIRLKIYDVEAYPTKDTANYGCAADGGFKPATSHTAPLFQLGGSCCIYGGMLLIVCGREGEPDNVLIRGAADTENRYDGPLKVSGALRLNENKQIHGSDLLTSDVLWIETDRAIGSVCKTIRQGLSHRVKEEDREKRCRFIKI